MKQKIIIKTFDVNSMVTVLNGINERATAKDSFQTAYYCFCDSLLTLIKVLEEMK